MTGIESMLMTLMTNMETLMQRPVLTDEMIKVQFDRYAQETIEPRLYTASLVNQKAIDDSKNQIWNGLKDKASAARQ